MSVVLPTSRFAYTYIKSKCFVKMDEHHCLQLPTVTRVLGARPSAFGAKTLQWTMITEPVKKVLEKEIEVTSWLVSADDFSSRVARGANERVSAANE